MHARLKAEGFGVLDLLESTSDLEKNGLKWCG